MRILRTLARMARTAARRRIGPLPSLLTDARAALRDMRQALRDLT